jgi:hypothetical protein
VKRDESDRHWAGGGPVVIDDDIRDGYLKLVETKVAAKLRR